MTSLQRKLSRAAKFRIGGKPDSDHPQYTEVHETYYRTLHPTRGWRFVSNARVFARQKMAEILQGRRAS